VVVRRVVIRASQQEQHRSCKPIENIQERVFFLRFPATRLAFLLLQVSELWYDFEKFHFLEPDGCDCSPSSPEAFPSAQ
jgi:hypothetical protein